MALYCGRWFCAMRDEPPELCTARRISNKVNAFRFDWVVNVMKSPIVKNPCFAFCHMHNVVATEELDFRMGKDRDMQASPIKPMMVDVSVPGYTGTRIEPEQSRSAPNSSKTRQHLAHVRRSE